MLQSQKEGIEVLPRENWAELSAAGVGSGSSGLWGCFHPSTPVMEFCTVPQRRAQLTAAHTFTELTKS